MSRFLFIFTLLAALSGCEEQKATSSGPERKKSAFGASVDGAKDLSETVEQRGARLERDSIEASSE